MNKIFMSVLFAVIVLMTSSCTTIPPGYAGIKVNYYGDDKGVSSYPLVSGRQLYNPFTTDVLQYPSFIQTVNLKKTDQADESVVFASQAGTRFTSEISISYHLVPDKIPEFYVKFRHDDLERFSHSFLRNIIRDSFAEESSKLTDEEVYATKKEEFLQKTRERVNKHVKMYGVEIDQLGFLSGPNAPDNVVAGINEKAAAIQRAIRAENELREIRAEQAKKVEAAEGDAKARVIEAQGQAEANRLITTSTTQNVLEWRKLMLQKEAIEKWNGTLPSTMLPGNSLPMVGIK